MGVVGGSWRQLEATGDSCLGTGETAHCSHKHQAGCAKSLNDFLNEPFDYIQTKRVGRINTMHPDPDLCQIQ